MQLKIFNKELFLPGITLGVVEKELSKTHLLFMDHNPVVTKGIA